MSSARHEARPDAAAEPASAPSEEAGAGPRTVGRYRILRALGQGGLGEVFEARAPDGQRVALKTFSLQTDPQGLIAAAFVREANLGQRLDHPDIVKVFESGTQGGLAYLVMEFVEGQDLRAFTHKGSLLPVPSVLRTVARVCGALASAHALHVVHRDIKPGNVLVNLDRDVVKLTDFGLARLGDAFISRTGLIAGTPGYMSPEQLAEGSVGPASDLYAVGVLLHELLTGRLPHEASSLGELLNQVANEVPRPVTEHRPELGQALAELVSALLAKRPEQRPASAGQLAARLMELSGEATAARRRGLISRP